MKGRLNYSKLCFEPGEVILLCSAANVMVMKEGQTYSEHMVGYCHSRLAMIDFLYANLESGQEGLRLCVSIELLLLTGKNSPYCSVLQGAPTCG